MSDLSREEEKRAFLSAHGWGRAKIAKLAGDASTRSYDRLILDGRSAVLMNAPPRAETPACPPDADEARREALGYNAVARLAGPDPRPFAALSAHLRSAGLSAPEILAADYGTGFLLIEDLGDRIYARTMREGTAPAPLYERAVDVLLRVHAQDAPKDIATPAGGTIALLSYDELARRAEAMLLLDWFLPMALGRGARDDERAAYGALWAAVEPLLADGPRVLVLRDFHAENLLWLPEREGPAAVGLLDFQDALVGAPAYDLVSLLEDARRDVEDEIRAAATARYVAARRAADPRFDADAFAASAAAHAAQRNAKIVGIFARLAKRDGKPGYLDLLPRVWSNLERDLAHPALAELKRWLDEVLPPARRNRKT